MSASSKFELSSASPDRPLYASGHRGSYGAATLDRSGSFRENLENPLLSSLPNMTRSTSSVTQGDVLNFFQCVRFDPKSMVVEHKLNRPAEFKRLASAAVGFPLEDSLTPTKNKLPNSAPEDLRRLKSGVRESGTKSRERVKILNDCLSVINKCFPTIPSRKRSRLDTLSNDRSNTLLPLERSIPTLGIGKIGPQNHASTSGFELEQQKADERSKSAFPNKRTRTSMVDARTEMRASTPSKPSGTMDKDRDAVRLSNSSAVQGEERSLSISVDGWEKAKMKKKRTGIKPDVSSSSVTTKPIDGFRETKQGMQPRLPTEARSRLNESHGFRPGVANGGLGVGKAEATSQTSSGIRSSISRTDSENSSLLHERRERPSGQEKERVNLKAVNRASSRDDLSSGSPTSSSKLNASIRAPRSGSVGGISKLSQVAQRSTPSDDWELTNCTSKLPSVFGANNRKRTPSARSTSPPVANWVQRPQKISRTARRTNLSPIVPENDENPALDIAEVMVNERRLPAHSPQHVKIKGDNFSPAALSETEESGAPEIKSRDKNKNCDEIDEKSGQNVQKMSTLLLPPRKSKATCEDDHGDGVKRQGRTGRGFTSSKPLLPLTAERLGNVGTTKQIRSSRLGLDKAESIAGRPPTRKLSDRKAYTRQKHMAISMTADFLVGSDNGHEELLAAANAVTNKSQYLSSSFWREMEPLFRFVSDSDISYLKEQVTFGSAIDNSAAAPFAADSSASIPNGCKLDECKEIETISVEVSPERSGTRAKTHNEISLFQRLISALIPEEGNQELNCSMEDLKHDVYESRNKMENDMVSDNIFPKMYRCSDLTGYPSSNGNGVTTNGNSIYELNHTMPENSIISIPNTMFIPSHDHRQNGLVSDQVLPGTTYSEYQYYSMPTDERLLVEVQSIGIYPDLVLFNISVGTISPLNKSDLAQNGDEDINEDIGKMDHKYQEQVSKKKRLLGKLLTSASEAKELQEKEFEGHALENLVAMAHTKYRQHKLSEDEEVRSFESCRGSNVHGMKSATGKMAKQAALAFVKRTLERCQEFEATGKSCFDEPFYRDMFLAGVSRFTDEQAPNLNTDNEFGESYLRTSGGSMEIRASAHVGALQSPSNNQEMYYSEVFPSSNLGSEANSGKEDSWSNRVKRRELLLDEVGVSTSPGVSSGLRGSLVCSAKGKRTERDREGKGNSREVVSRSGTAKIGRPTSATVKGERKSKAKPKQKNVHLSASINGPLGMRAEQTKGMLPSTLKSNHISGRDAAEGKNDYNLEILEQPIDLSGLQLPDMDPNDFGGQGEDIGSWLDIEDDGLQDHDYMGGLEIPMDDLTNLNMMI
ncbi:hypothetical protein F511_27621 [Dorcoceras hygrometricum]|uniref:Uncharacterized protein n=1 Tax=Dorcoceras hygrometricum TaxID=472368 RepID=A0A2Z7CWZ4_9LAMI|nr:hypothetical protein F511_27621 [Dorcoceras hygrometricum]